MNTSVDLPTAVLTELPSEVAVLDDEANVVHTNGTWRRFAEDNGLAGDPASIGQNYLDVCDANPESESARGAADGVRSLLAGERETFSVEYRCHTPDERRYFSVNAKRFRHGGETYALMVRADVTGPGLPPERRDEAFDAGFTTGDDENTGLGLSVVEGVVDAHGWEVRVTDGRDGGARFEVRV